MFWTDGKTGCGFSHWKEWIGDRLELLAGIFAVDVMGFAGLSNHLHLVAGWHSLNWLCCAATGSSGVNVELSWHVGFQKKVLSGASCACGTLPLRGTANWHRLKASGGCQSPDVWFKCRKWFNDKSYSARPGLRDVLLSEPQGVSGGLCIRSAPAASALPITKPQI